MGRSRKMRGGDPTMQVSTDAITALANTAIQLSTELGNLVPNVASPVSPLNSEASAAVVQPNADSVQSPNSEASSPNPVVDPNAVVQPNDSEASSPNPVVDPNAVVQPNDSGSAAADQPSNAAAAPSVPAAEPAPESAAPEPASLLTPGSLISYGKGLSIPYGNISKILENMINNPKYNKQKKPIADLQTLLTQIQSAKTAVEVSNILRTNAFNVVGKGVSNQYFSMTGGTKKRKRTKMTKRRKTRKMKKTRKMRKMRKTMKI
jgi:hypothetical protein